MNPQISSLISSVRLEPWMLGMAFAAFLLLYGVIGAILFYHWRRYGMKNKNILIGETIFLLGTGLFVYMAIIGIMIY